MMKPVRFSCLTLLLSLCVGGEGLFTSCETYDFADETLDEEKLTSVRILIRAASESDDIYPLRIYAFAQDGSLRTSQTIRSSEEKISLQLPQNVGTRVVVVAADDATYHFSGSPSATDLITLKEPQFPSGASFFGLSIAKDYAASHPLQMAFADITPTTTSATLNLQMYYQMSAVQFSFTGLPFGCTSVCVTVASPYEAISLEGNFVSSQKSVIPLVHEAGSTRWTSGEVYIFPSSGSQTYFTIAYDDGKNEQFAQVTYQEPMRAGVPYILNGTLHGGVFDVTGSVAPPQWGTPESLTFTFSPDSVVTIGSRPVESGVIEVDALPEPLSLWNGHLVVSVTPLDDSSATLMFVSLSDFAGLTSSLNADTPQMALDQAQNYREYEITSWHIPTVAEARQLREAYLSVPDVFDELLLQVEGDAIVFTDAKGENVRYLCEEATKTYSFKSGTAYNSVKDAGASVKNYHLRLVTTVKARKFH